MKNNKQTGMTLIEIMIALLIGAFLLGGVLQVFVGSKQTFRMQENLSQLQENGRFAMSFLSKDIREVGYWGCLVRGTPNSDIAGTNDNAVTTDTIKNATDTITLKGAFTQPLPTDTSPPTKSCGDSVDTTATYYTDSTSTITYKINTDGVLQRDSSPLIEGVENMQILYGVDTDSIGSTDFGTPNYYLPADSAWTDTDWSKVVSIRVSILVATLDDNLTEQPVAYTYNGTTTTPTDRRIRRVFNTTIAVRNRLL